MLVHLAGLTNLEKLELDGTQVTGIGMMSLVGLKCFEDWRTQVTDAGLVHLAGLTNLEQLYLDRSQVTDAGLMHLAGLTNLTDLP